MSKKRVELPPWTSQQMVESINGRIKYTKTYCEDMAEDLMKTVQEHQDMYILRPFFSARGMCREQIKVCKEICEKFRLAYNLCKQICSDRFHQLVLEGKLNASYAARVANFYDHELWDHSIEDKKRIAKAQVEGATEAGGKDNLIHIIVKD